MNDTADSDQSMPKSTERSKGLTWLAKTSKCVSYGMRVHKWLPASHGKSFLFLLFFAVIQAALFLLPIATSKILKNDFPWKSNDELVSSISGHIAIDIIIMILVFNSLFLASCCRHYTTFTNGISELAGAVLITVVLTVVILSAAKGASDDFSKEFLGLKVWLGSYGLLTAYALKPMLDEMLERMYPKPKRAEESS
jgi:hypothetical protein